MADIHEITERQTQARESRHQALMRSTEFMPCKKIIVNDALYLERYYVNTDKHGNQNCLHRFLRNDPELHLHGHPWIAVSEILTGWYIEEFINDRGVVTTLHYGEGKQNIITPNKIHRICRVMPNTWTALRIGAERLDSWHFIEQDGVKVEKKASPIDWWTSCKTRDGKEFDLTKTPAKMMEEL